MTIVGAQDFQSGEQWQSQLLLNASQFLVGGANHTWPDTGPATIPVSNWQGIQFKANAASGGDYVFRWWANAAGGNQLGERRFTVSTTFTDTYLTLANLGPFLTVQVFNASVSNFTASFLLTGSNRIAAPFQPGSSAPMLDQANVSVGPGASVTRTASYLYAGSVSVWTFTTAVNWVIGFFSVDSNGAGPQIARVVNAEAAAYNDRRFLMIVPPRPLQVTWTNQDGGAQAFYTEVVPDMFR